MWKKPVHPWIYEINARVWLKRLRQEYRAPFGLGDVPADEWRRIKDLGMDLVWLMGVWRPSQASREIAWAHQGLQAEYARVLADACPSDVAGSPYAVAGYQLSPLLGSPVELAVLKEKLNGLGLGLILDLVPNHTARDHPWCEKRPDLYVMSRDKGWFQPSEAFECGEAGEDPWWVAHGRDPYFPPWTDTAQLNAANPDTRAALAEIALGLTDVCDGLRCDMAMLAMNRIFSQTWGKWMTKQGQSEPADEFWPTVAGPAKAKRPDFLFIAEAYWGTEGELLRQGFDYCYDKGGYDLLSSRNGAGMAAALEAEGPEAGAKVRFLENHDEERAASRVPASAMEACVAAFLFLPGMKLFQQGQLQGARVKLPVQLCRAPSEPRDERIAALYETILSLANQPLFKQGQFTKPAFAGDASGERGRENLLVHLYRRGDSLGLAAANLSDYPARGALAPAKLPALDKLAFKAGGPTGGLGNRPPSLSRTAKGWLVDAPPCSWGVWVTG